MTHTARFRFYEEPNDFLPPEKRERQFEYCFTGSPSVIAALPEKTREYYDEFYKCASCGKVYWQGGHFEKLKKTAEATGGGP
jgi:uncharacterized protein with PIN domain